MSKVISPKVLISVFFLIGAFVILGLFLIPGFIAEEPATKVTIPKTQTPESLPSNNQEMPKEPSIFGIYEVCSEIDNCDIEAGIKKVKETGAEAVIITVVDEEGLKSEAYYPSKYLPTVEDLPQDYLERIIKFAHENQIKVYGSINIPHNYWLAKHPDWIAYLSNGKRADFYEKDYFHRIVPPSRIISEKECIELLQNLIDEVISYGVDGIDINDNFQFSDQYLEESDSTIFSSFDDFTIEKFENETNNIVRGNSAKEKANYIKNNPEIYADWLKWRSKQITKLLEILNEITKNYNPNIPLRPHLLTYGDPYEHYGLDYQEIVKQVDVLYLMITPDQPKEKYFEVIKEGQNAKAEKIAVSTYLFEQENWTVPEKDVKKILERMKWIVGAGADEVYVYNFELIEKGNLWPALKSTFDNIRTIED